MDDTTDDTSSTGTPTTTSCYDRWTREASRNPILAAAEIYFMACPRDRLPWRQLLQMSRGRGGTSPEDLFARPPPPPERWAGRRTRRRRTGPEAAASASAAEEDSATAVAVTEAAVATKEPRRMDSPTTPLSWTTTAASSGSGGSEAAARDDDAVTTAAAAGSSVAATGSSAPPPPPTTTTVVLPVFGKKRPRRSDAEPTSFTVPSSAVVPAPSSACPVVSSLSHVPAAAATPTGNSRSVLGLTDATASGTTTDGAVATGSGGGGAGAGAGGGGVGYASVSRTTRLLLGKKMTLVELKCYEQSLLQQNMDMRKELELQRKAQKVLVEENARLKMLKSKHQPQAARQLFVVAKDVVSSAKCPFLPFDLNMPAAEDAVDPSGQGFH